MKNKMIKLPVFLAAVTAICTVLLGFVYQLTITQIKKDEEFRADSAYGELYDKAKISYNDYGGIWVNESELTDDKYKNIVASDKAGEGENEGKKLVVKTILNNDAIVGYAIIATGEGFQKAVVKMMFGFNEKAELIGVKALDVSTQSPGYGADFAAKNEKVMLKYLQSNPDTASISQADNNIMSGSTVTINGMLKAYVASYSLVKDIKG